MCKYLKFIFVIPLFFIGCSEEEELPYKDLKWISFDRDYIGACGNSVGTTVYALNSSNSHPAERGCSGENGTWVDAPNTCKWIHYYEDEAYFEYEKNSSTETESYDLSSGSRRNIQYEEK